MADNGPEAEQAAHQLQDTRRELQNLPIAIRELKKLFMKVNKQWIKSKDRIIGYVVWAPPMSFATAPHRYTEDVRVIKLDKKKFSQNFRGNVIDLGTY